MIAGLVVGMVTACSGSSTAPGRARSPERAAQAFIEAIGAGRAGDALAFLRVQPLDRTLLTDQVLADAVRKAPIVGVTAHARGGARRTRMVDVAYRMGGDHVTDTYKVVQVGRYWFVDETLPAVPVFDDRPAYAAVTVSGKKVATPDPDSYSSELSSTPILPGRYQLGLDNPLLGVERAEFTVTSLHAPATLTGAGPQARLTDDGRARVAAAAKDKLDACMQATTLRTACGISYSSERVFLHGRSYILMDNTATWVLDTGGTDLLAAAPQWKTCQWFDPGKKSVVCADDLAIFVYMTAHTSDGGTEVDVSKIVGYAADLSDPDHIRIIFGRD